MRFRSVLHEHEARLEPPPAGLHPAARGKAEWKVYGDGTRQSKVSVSRLTLADGAVVELVLEQRRIAQLTVLGGAARCRLETEKGDSVPVVDVDQLLQVTQAGQVLLEGRFYAE